MTRATLTLALLALSTGNVWAYRILEQHESAYELVLGEVVLPGSAAGSVIFKACDDCKSTALRVSAATRYFVNGTELALADFLRLAEEIRQTAGGNENTAVYLFFDIESQRVNRLKLDRLAQH